MRSLLYIVDVVFHHVRLNLSSLTTSSHTNLLNFIFLFFFIITARVFAFFRSLSSRFLQVIFRHFVFSAFHHFVFLNVNLNFLITRIILTVAAWTRTTGWGTTFARGHTLVSILIRAFLHHIVFLIYLNSAFRLVVDNFALINLSLSLRYE